VLADAVRTLNSLPENGSPSEDQQALLTATLAKLKTALAALSRGLPAEDM
jgi:hypothetical protein